MDQINIDAPVSSALTHASLLVRLWKVITYELVKVASVLYLHCRRLHFRRGLGTAPDYRDEAETGRNACRFIDQIWFFKTGLLRNKFLYLLNHYSAILSHISHPLKRWVVRSHGLAFNALFLICWMEEPLIALWKIYHSTMPTIRWLWSSSDW